jgi:hypothetical protein
VGAVVDECKKALDHVAVDRRRRTALSRRVWAAIAASVRSGSRAMIPSRSRGAPEGLLLAPVASDEQIEDALRPLEVAEV